MTSQQILTKAIQKAVDNGWNIFDEYFTPEKLFNNINNDNEQYCKLYEFISVEGIIFSHDFAKAFWLNYEDVTADNGYGYLEAWQFHLQQMVLEKDPIQYLGKFLWPETTSKQ